MTEVHFIALYIEAMMYIPMSSINDTRDYTFVKIIFYKNVKSLSNINNSKLQKLHIENDNL